MGGDGQERLLQPPPQYILASAGNNALSIFSHVSLGRREVEPRE
jgi:hypothetical protein